jgi:sigma-B regulation protein RsbU (phosphoserine phosphatase)
MSIKNRKMILGIELGLFTLSIVFTWTLFNSPLLNNLEKNLQFAYSIRIIELLNLILLTGIVYSLYESMMRENTFYRLFVFILLVPVLFFEALNIFNGQHNILLYELGLVLLFSTLIIQSLTNTELKQKIYKFIIALKFLFIVAGIILYINDIFNVYELLFQGIILIFIGFSLFKMKYHKENMNLLIGLIILINSLVILLYNNTVVKSVEIFTFDTIRFIGLILVFSRLFAINQHRTREFISNREKQIKLYADKINRVIEKRTREIEKMNEKLDEDLEYARSIQQSLLPAKEETFNDVTFISNYFPCEKLSGDFYDIFRIDDNHIGMYLLDVSGHGVSAAMLTMFCKNSIISGERLIRRFRGLKPHKNLEHFYNLFNSASFPPETHMVMFFAAYNTETKVLKYSSGGLNCYPILRKNNGEIYELSDNNGFPISKLGDLYTPEYTSSTIKLNDQDLVFFYTDGLIDYQKNQVIDYDELINLIKENGNARVIDQILEEKINNNKNHLNDDITYFIMEV